MTLTKTPEATSLIADAGSSAAARRLMLWLALAFAALAAWGLIGLPIMLVRTLTAGTDDPATIWFISIVGSLFSLGLAWISWGLWVTRNRLRRWEEQGLLISVEQDAVRTASVRIPASEIRRVRIRWRQFHRPPEFRLGHRLARMITDGWERRTGLGVHRTVFLERTHGPVVVVHAAVLASAEDFGRLIEALTGMLDSHGIPHELVA